jgi:hypothetical protein
MDKYYTARNVLRAWALGRGIEFMLSSVRVGLAILILRPSHAASVAGRGSFWRGVTISVGLSF